MVDRPNQIESVSALLQPLHHLGKALQSPCHLLQCLLFSLGFKLETNVLLLSLPRLIEVEEGGLKVLLVCFCSKMEGNLLLDMPVDLHIIWSAALACFLPFCLLSAFHFPNPLFHSRLHFLKFNPHLLPGQNRLSLLPHAFPPRLILHRGIRVLYCSSPHSPRSPCTYCPPCPQLLLLCSQ